MMRIWPGLKKILIAIGRWLFRVVRERGVPMLVMYMSERVRVFKRRLQRAKTDRRRVWLRGRIRRWTAAAKWLTDHLVELNAVALDQCRELADRIPETSPMEKFS